MKKLIKVLLIVLPLIVLSLYITNVFTFKTKEVEVGYAHMDYAYDVENPLVDIGFADYVFIGKVNEDVKTTYLGATDKDPSGIPETTYSITVIQNLKGKLKKDIPVEFTKWGGISYDQTMITIVEGDVLLEVGKYYLLIGAEQKDGGIRQTGPYSAIELEYDNKADILSSEIYKEYLQYVKDEVKFNRNRFKSPTEEE